MKKLFLIAVVLFAVSAVKSQTTDTIRKKKIIIDDTWKNKKEPQRPTIHYYRNYGKDSVDVLNVLKIVETKNGGNVRVGQVGLKVHNDTTEIRIWKRKISICDGWRNSKIRIERVDSWEDDDTFYGNKKQFNGHWSGFELGFSTLINADYGMYDPKYDGFMDLYQGKSSDVNLNFIEWNIGLQKKDNTIGLVTGMGLEWNNYRFDREITITEDENGVIQPLPLNNKWDIKKSKLTALYLNVPLFVEFQIRTDKKNRAHIALGVVGGLRISSHTKIKYKTNGDTEKDKDFDNFNLNTLRCAAMARVGYRSLNFYVTYGITRLFEKDKGPKLTPFNVGVTLVSF